MMNLNRLIQRKLTKATNILGKQPQYRQRQNSFIVFICVLVPGTSTVISVASLHSVPSLNVMLLLLQPLLQPLLLLLRTSIIFLLLREWPLVYSVCVLVMFVCSTTGCIQFVYSCLFYSSLPSVLLLLGFNAVDSYKFTESSCSKRFFMNYLLLAIERSG